jgi:putative Mg2+ transporter-C (MgtC) family protein
MEPSGQGWSQIAEFGIAFVLSGAIGLEREIRQKAAGLRTYTVVGLGAALFTLVSKYGFTDVLSPGHVVLDPSRVTAQIVSGLGFIGAGVIFVQRGSVRGLTTAASIWLTAAVGAAAAAGLPLLALAATVGYFLLAYGLRPLAHRLPVLRERQVTYHVTYMEGTGLLRDLVALCVDAGFLITDLETLSRTDEDGTAGAEVRVDISMGVQGRGDPDRLLTLLAGREGVLACRRTDSSDE